MKGYFSLLMCLFQCYWQYCEVITWEVIFKQQFRTQHVSQQCEHPSKHFLCLFLFGKRVGNFGTRCSHTISGKSNLQYELLFKFWVSKRPLIIKHFCFWRQNEPCFLYTDWCIGGRNTFLKQMHGLLQRRKNKLFYISFLSWLPPVL